MIDQLIEEALRAEHTNALAAAPHAHELPTPDRPARRTAPARSTIRLAHRALRAARAATRRTPIPVGSSKPGEYVIVRSRH